MHALCCFFYLSLYFLSHHQCNQRDNKSYLEVYIAFLGTVPVESWEWWRRTEIRDQHQWRLELQTPKSFQEEGKEPEMPLCLVSVFPSQRCYGSAFSGFHEPLDQEAPSLPKTSNLSEIKIYFLLGSHSLSTTSFDAVITLQLPIDGPLGFKDVSNLRR